MGAIRRGSGSVSGGVPFAFAQYGSGESVGEDVSPTLRTGSGGSVTMTADDTAVRRLTPLEYERLFGYPDEWTANSHGRPQSDAARYRQLGNSFAVPVVEWIARRLVRVVAQR